MFVLIVPGGKVFTSLIYVRLSTIRTG